MQVSQLFASLAPAHQIEQVAWTPDEIPLPDPDRMLSGRFEPRWVPGPAFTGQLKVDVARFDVIEDWEPVNCRLDLIVGCTTIPLQRVVMAACPLTSVELLMTTIDDKKAFGFNVRYTLLSNTVRRLVSGQAIATDEAIQYTNGVARVDLANANSEHADHISPSTCITLEYSNLVKTVEETGESRPMQLFQMLGSTDAVAVSGPLEMRWDKSQINVFVRRRDGLCHRIVPHFTFDVLEAIDSVDCQAVAVTNSRVLGDRALLAGLRFNVMSMEMRFDGVTDVADLPDRFGFDARMLFVKGPIRDRLHEGVRDGPNIYLAGLHGQGSGC